MLPSKPKRPPAAGRAARAGDDPTDDEGESRWSSHLPAGAPVDPPAAEPGRTRLLRTADAKPTAPRLQDLFPRETRSIDRVITLWDPAGAWAAGALADLHGPGVAEIGATRLVQADAARTFAEIHHTTVTTAAGELCAVLHVEANPTDAAGADVAMMLLERSDHAVVLTAGGIDQREVPRRLNDFCRQATWRGPTLQFLTPQDKPSRADRLRKTTWHRSLRMQVVEWPLLPQPGWLVALLERVAEGVTFDGVARPAEDGPARVLVPAPDDPDRLVAPPPRPPGAALRRRPPPQPLPARPAPQRLEQALAVAALAPGCAGSAIIDTYTDGLLAVHGNRHQTEAGATRALQLWARYADGADAADGAAAAAPDTPADELVWTVGPLHHIALPVPSQPGLVMLALVDREFGDLARARWQLAVARNEFA